MVDPNIVLPAVLGGMGAISTPIALVKLNRQTRRHLMDLARHAKLPKGAVEIRTQPEPGDRSGRIMLILVGTFAGSLGVRRLLVLLAQNGLEGLIGSVMLIELDNGERAGFLQYLRQNAPVFLDRLEVVSFDGLPAGLGNADPDTVLKYIDRWGPPIVTGLRNAVAVHQRRQHGQEPGFGLLLLSLGGTAITGALLARTLTETLVPNIQLYGMTACPVDDVLRQRIPRIIHDYMEAGLRGFVVADNMADEVANDFGQVGTVVGLALAAKGSDATVATNNAWFLMFENAPGHLVRFSTWINRLPGYLLTPTHPEVPLRYITSHTAVNSTLLTGMDQVRRPQYDSLGGRGQYNIIPPNTSEFEIALAAIERPDLKTIEDEIVLAQQLKGRNKANYHLAFAPMTTTIPDPSQATSPVGLVWLRAMNDGPEWLHELADPHRRPRPQIPGTGNPAQSPVIYLPSGKQTVVQPR